MIGIILSWLVFIIVVYVWTGLKEMHEIERRFGAMPFKMRLTIVFMWPFHETS